MSRDRGENDYNEINLKTTEFPYFVSGGLRLKVDNEYWRDGGAWGVYFMISKFDNKVTFTGGSHVDHLKGKKAEAITYEEYYKLNGGCEEGGYGYSIDRLVEMGYDRDKIMSCGKEISNNRRYLLIG